MKSNAPKVSGGGGGGAGTPPGLETRVAVVEAEAKHLREAITTISSASESLRQKIDGVSVGVAKLEVQVANLPGKGFIVSAVVAALAFLAAIEAFGDKIRAFFH